MDPSSLIINQAIYCYIAFSFHYYVCSYVQMLPIVLLFLWLVDDIYTSYNAKMMYHINHVFVECLDLFDQRMKINFVRSAKMLTKNIVFLLQKMLNQRQYFIFRCH